MVSPDPVAVAKVARNPRRDTMVAAHLPGRINPPVAMETCKIIREPQRVHYSEMHDAPSDAPLR